MKAALLVALICLVESSFGFVPLNVKRTGNHCHNVSGSRSIKCKSSSSSPSVEVMAGTFAASLFFVSTLLSPANAISTSSAFENARSIGEQGIDIHANAKSVHDSTLINGINPGTENKEQFAAFLQSNPIESGSSIVLSSEEEVIGGMTSGQRKAGEWFFLAYVVFSLLAGAKEMTERFQKWSSRND